MPLYSLGHVNYILANGKAIYNLVWTTDVLTYTITDQLKKGEKMFRKLATLLLIALSATEILAQSTATKNIYNSIRGETYETKADTTTHAFIESFMIKDKGYFNVSYKHYAFNAYWTQAHAIDVVVYAY